MNILRKEIFVGIFVYIACWNCLYDFLECSDNKTSKFNSFAFTLIVQCYTFVSLVVQTFFVHWWMKGIYFVSFYFRVWDLTRKNKNPAEIFTYTVALKIEPNFSSRCLTICEKRVLHWHRAKNQLLMQMRHLISKFLAGNLFKSADGIDSFPHQLSSKIHLMICEKVPKNCIASTQRQISIDYAN